jgi:hypothetical protein
VARGIPPGIQSVYGVVALRSTARARYTLSLSEILVSGAGKNNGTYMRRAGVPAAARFFPLKRPMAAAVGASPERRDQR